MVLQRPLQGVPSGGADLRLGPISKSGMMTVEQFLEPAMPGEQLSETSVPKGQLMRPVTAPAASLPAQNQNCMGEHKHPCASPHWPPLAPYAPAHSPLAGAPAPPASSLERERK